MDTPSDGRYNTATCGRKAYSHLQLDTANYYLRTIFFFFFCFYNFFFLIILVFGRPLGWRRSVFSYTTTTTTTSRATEGDIRDCFFFFFSYFGASLLSISCLVSLVSFYHCYSTTFILLFCCSAIVFCSIHLFYCLCLCRGQPATLLAHHFTSNGCEKEGKKLGHGYRARKLLSSQALPTCRLCILEQEEQQSRYHDALTH